MLKRWAKSQVSISLSPLKSLPSSQELVDPATRKLVPLQDPLWRLIAAPRRFRRGLDALLVPVNGLATKAREGGELLA